MKKTIDFLINNGKVVDGPINKNRPNELFVDTSEQCIKYIPFMRLNKKHTKVKNGGIVEAIKIAESEYSTLYRVISVMTPNGFKEDMKLDINKDDVFHEQKFYTYFKKIEKAKKEFDNHFDDYENDLRFNPLSNIVMAKNWYETLTELEISYVDLLIKDVISEC